MTTTRKLVYPHPVGTQHIYIADFGLKFPCHGLHPTDGLSHNWALDFMAPGGTPLLACEAGVIWKLSGHDPNEGEHNSIFGWNVYIQTKDGLLYFQTHIGDYNVSLGQKVKLGQKIGHVGHWPNDPGRSHTHIGVSHPMGDAASKRAICNVGQAKHVKGV